MAEGTRMQQRRDTEAHWVTSNYLLAAGEIGFSTDTNTIKVGNGTSHWVDLPIAFEGDFLPLHGTADNSLLIGGISASSFLNTFDITTAATADKGVKRTSTGTAKAATATASDDLVPLAQMNAALRHIVPRTVTAAATLALTDVNGMLLVNHSSLTAQVVITIPTNTSVAFAVGDWVDVVAIGAGGAKITPAGTVTLNGSSNAYPGYGCVRLIKTATNTWMGISMNAGKRLPKIRCKNAGTGSYSATTSYTNIPWASVDTTWDFYNPDNEWFSIPAAGLPTARRVVVNKDGEYLLQCRFLCSSTALGSLVIGSMPADNDMTGGEYYANISTHSNNSVSARVRLTAGTAVGAAFESPSAGVTDVADGTSGNKCDFSITRLSD